MTASAYLANIIKQLFVKYGQLPDDIESDYDTYLKQDRKPTYQLLLKLFEFIVKEFKHVYLMLDALDELKQRTEFLQLLHRIAVAKKGSTYEKIRVFVTSRREQDIRNVFKDVPIVEIEAKNVIPDITQFVKSEIKRHLDEGNLTVEDSHLVENIKSKLVEKSDGMCEPPWRRQTHVSL